MDFILWATVIHIHDLGTFDYLIRGRETSSIRPNYFGASFASVKRLHLTFWIPFGLCAALEQQAAACPGTVSSSAATTSHGANTDWHSQVVMWSQLYENVTQLKELCALHVWLDHADNKSWTRVNERAILSPFTLIGTHTDFKFTVNLPKLHPGLAKPDRHFMMESPGPSFVLRRRFRQNYFAVTDSQGELSIAGYDDFPELHDHLGLQDMSWDELEKFETELWQGGEEAWKELFYNDPLLVI